jgi:hypothetical protein
VPESSQCSLGAFVGYDYRDDRKSDAEHRTDDGARKSEHSEHSEIEKNNGDQRCGSGRDAPYASENAV